MTSKRYFIITNKYDHIIQLLNIVKYITLYIKIIIVMIVIDMFVKLVKKIAALELFLVSYQSFSNYLRIKDRAGAV